MNKNTLTKKKQFKDVFDITVPVFLRASVIFTKIDGVKAILRLRV